MPPSFRPAGVRGRDGRDNKELFRFGERNPPVGTRLGIPFKGAVTKRKLCTILFHNSECLHTHKTILS